MANTERLIATIPEEMAGLRLDQAVAALFPDYSRARLQQWIRSGQATVDAKNLRPKDRVLGGERVELRAEPVASDDWTAEPLPLDIIHQDPDLLIVNKPAGLVVHPGAGNRTGTLLNALLHFDPALATVPRAGVVHRLDKGTTGLLMIARNLRVHKRLVDQLKARAVRRTYEAVVVGRLTAGGRIDEPIGRHRVQRTRMAISASGKPAITHYRVLHRFAHHTHVQVTLDTGRTHQIRVHMAHIGHPLIGDPVYGGRLRIPANATLELQEILQGFKRQALHAVRLELRHPGDDRELRFETPLPPDILGLLESLRGQPRQ